MPYASHPFTFSTSTTAPPAVGELRLDSTDQPTASTLIVSDVDLDAESMATFLGAIVADTFLRITETDDGSRTQPFVATGPAVAGAGYHSIPLAESTFPPGGLLRNGRGVQLFGVTAAAYVGGYASAEELAAAVRVPVSSKNADLLDYCVRAASEEIDHDVGRPPEDPIPAGNALAHMTCIARGVEWYKANDVAFGALGFDNTGVLTAPADGFARHSTTLIPLKRSFGIA